MTATSLEAVSPSSASTFAPRRTLIDLAGLPGCMLLYAVLVRCYLSFPSTVEDSFIMFRYASHLASHQGLSWNVGAPHEQGMTGIVWALLVGAIHSLLHKDPAIVAGYMGIFWGCAALWLLYLALRRALSIRYRSFALLGTLALALTPIFLRHSANGMETSLMFFVCSLTVYWAAVLPAHCSLAACAGTALLSAGSYLVRPDAPLFCLAALLPILFWDSPQRRPARTLAVLVASVGLVAAEVLILGRYFTTALPLPAYVKVSLSEAIRHPHEMLRLIPWILSYQFDFLSTMAVWLVCVALAAFSDWRKLSIRVWATLFGASIFYLYLFTIFPVMNFNMRYQAPLMIPLIFAGTVALTVVLEALDGTRGKRGPVMAVLCLLLVLFSFGDLSRMKSDARAEVDDHAVFKLIGMRVRQIPMLKVASTEAGNLAYFSDAKFLDLIGLNNAFVALNHKRPDYGIRLDQYLSSTFNYPDLYVRSTGGSGPYADLCSFPDIIARYEYVGSLDPSGQNEIFILRASEHARQLESLLGNLVLSADSSKPRSGCGR